MSGMVPEYSIKVNIHSTLPALHRLRLNGNYQPFTWKNYKLTRMNSHNSYKRLFNALGNIKLVIIFVGYVLREVFGNIQGKNT